MLSIQFHQILEMEFCNWYSYLNIALNDRVAQLFDQLYKYLQAIEIIYLTTL